MKALSVVALVSALTLRTLAAGFNESCTDILYGAARDDYFSIYAYYINASCIDCGGARKVDTQLNLNKCLGLVDGRMVPMKHGAFAFNNACPDCWQKDTTLFCNCHDHEAKLFESEIELNNLINNYCGTLTCW